MAFSVNEIKSQLQFGGARPSLFQVRFTNPATGEADLKVPFMVKAAQLPASTVSQIEVPYFGRRIKVAGTRTYENWSVTVINDEDFKIRRAIEAWSRRINTYIGNLRDFGTAAPAEYKSRAEVIQYGQTGNILRTYQFEGIFPLNIGAIELNWESGDQVEEFTVEFAVDYWTVPGEPA
jgi:hypothetical protein